MAGQVILYFDDQADALRFALAAGSVMAGDGSKATDDLVHETPILVGAFKDTENMLLACAFAGFTRLADEHAEQIHRVA